MIGQKVTLSKESRMQIIIQDLNRLGIHEGKNGERLERMDYYSLRSLLALKQAVES